MNDQSPVEFVVEFTTHDKHKFRTKTLLDTHGNLRWLLVRDSVTILKDEDSEETVYRVDTSSKDSSFPMRLNESDIRVMIDYLHTFFSKPEFIVGKDIFKVADTCVIAPTVKHMNKTVPIRHQGLVSLIAELSGEYINFDGVTYYRSVYGYDTVLHIENGELFIRDCGEVKLTVSNGNNGVEITATVAGMSKTYKPQMLFGNQYSSPTNFVQRPYRYTS